jgi:hypothetical protein
MERAHENSINNPNGIIEVAKLIGTTPTIVAVHQVCYSVLGHQPQLDVVFAVQHGELSSPNFAVI